MEWQVKSISKVCHHTGRVFIAGDSVLCFLYRDQAGVLQRIDLHEEDHPMFIKPRSVLGRWKIKIKAVEDSQKEAQKHQYATVEAMFLSLYEGEEEKDSGDIDRSNKVIIDQEAFLTELDYERQALKQVLALILERKRILRFINRGEKSRSESAICYLHVKSKQTYWVPMMDLPDKTILRIQENLKSLMAWQII